MKDPNDDDPFLPMKLSIVGAIALVVVILVLAGCAAPELTTHAERVQFPTDMGLACMDGWFVIGSESAGQIVRLPIRCQEA